MLLSAAYCDLPDHVHAVNDLLVTSSLRCLLELAFTYSYMLETNIHACAILQLVQQPSYYPGMYC